MTLASTPATSSLLEDAAQGRAMLLPWTVEQYHWAIRTGFLDEDPAYELLDGWIVRKDRSATGEDPMTIGDRHRLSVIQLTRLTSTFDGHGCFLQTQQPIALPPHHEPEPDGAIIRGDATGHRDGPPGPADVLCVIEVSDASLRRDHGVKFKAYQAAKIPLYVIVNLVDNRVEVYSMEPTGAFSSPRLLQVGDTLHLPTTTDVTVDVPVAQLLP